MTVPVTKKTTNNTIYSAQEPHIFFINIQWGCIQSLIINHLFLINTFTAFFY